MATEVLMPALSPTMTEGKIARWLKNEGEPVSAGDVLAEIETDKATMEVEAVDEGVLTRIVIPEGTDHVAVNTPIAVIAANGEKADTADRRRSGGACGRVGDKAGGNPAGPARLIAPAGAIPWACAGNRARICRQDENDDGARRFARCDRRGNATGRVGVFARRRGRRIPGRL